MSESCGDAAAYVLGALEPDEADRFRDHLSSCAICRDEVASLGPVVDMLPAAVPQHAAPRALRRRVMKEVRREARVQVRPRRSPAMRLVPALAVATAVLVALFIVASTNRSSSPGVSVIRAAVPGSPGATALIDRYGSRAVLVVSGLKPAPHGRVYEVWERSGTRTWGTNSLFTVARDGTATASIPGNLTHVDTMMVTAEPRGGSTTPTSPPVIVARI